MCFLDRSPVFEAIFTQNMKEGLTGEIDMPDFDSKVIEEFVGFLYTGEADLSNFAADLFRISDKYDVAILRLTCENYLIGSVSTENVLDRFTLGNMLNSKGLIERYYAHNKVQYIFESLYFYWIRIKIIIYFFKSISECREKKKIFKTKEELLSFQLNYPDLAFSVLLN